MSSLLRATVLCALLATCGVCLVAGALLAGCGGPEPRRRERSGGLRPSADVVEGRLLELLPPEGSPVPRG